MLARSSVHRLGLVLAIAGAYGFCATPGPGAGEGSLVPTALAGPAPTGGSAEFDITYYVTEYDAEGNPERGRRLTANDLSYFVNKARCECGQQIMAEVKARVTGAVAPTTRVRVYVGARCEEGETGINPQARPCVRLAEETLGYFTAGAARRFPFGPLWIGSGVVPGTDQAIADAQASGNCQSQQGFGGIWICVETNGQPACQSDEWVVQGNQNLNIGESDMAQGVAYDYDGPLVEIADAQVQSGDGALLVTWDQTVSGDAYGFRVLCVDENGQPVPGKDGYSASASDITEQHDGTIYYTKDNLCPEGPFSEVIEGEGSNQGDPGPSDTGGVETDGGDSGGQDTGGSDTGSAAAPIFEGDRVVLHSQLCCTAIPGGTCGGSTEDNVCAAMVNAKRPACASEWDDACASLALEYCPDCGGQGYCCAAHGLQGCSNDACEAAVCTGEFLECCTIGWDSTCSARAASLDACSDACTVEGDTGSTSDDGTTGSDTTGSDTTTGSGSGSGSDTASSSGSDTGADEGPAGEALRTLDWRYVCSGHVSGRAESVRISGLENEREYRLLVVAYDRNGNPTMASDVLSGRPRETTDFWEQCAEQGDLCGSGGFCSCSVDAESEGRSTLLFLGLLGLGGWMRRRRRAA